MIRTEETEEIVLDTNTQDRTEKKTALQDQLALAEFDIGLRILNRQTEAGQLKRSMVSSFNAAVGQGALGAFDRITGDATIKDMKKVKRLISQDEQMLEHLKYLCEILSSDEPSDFSESRVGSSEMSLVD